MAFALLQLPLTHVLPMTRAAAAARCPPPSGVVMPDMSPNSLLFLQDHGPGLNYFGGGDLKSLWQAIPRTVAAATAVRDCSTPLCYCMGGNLMALWSSMVESERCAAAAPRVGARRTAAITMSEPAYHCMSADGGDCSIDYIGGGDLASLWSTMSEPAERCMSADGGDCSIDYFWGGDLISLWKTLWNKVEPPRMRGRPAARARSPGVVAMDAGRDGLNFFSGGDLRCLWMKCMSPMRSEAAAEPAYRCMSADGGDCSIDYIGGGDLASLWKAAK